MSSGFASALSIAECHVLALVKLEEQAEIGGQLFFISDFTMDYKQFFQRANKVLGGTKEIPENPRVRWPPQPQSV